LPYQLRQMANGTKNASLLKIFLNYLVLPTLFGLPRQLTSGVPGNVFCASYNVWGVEEQLRELNKEGNAILVNRFDLDKFSRALAKIAHGTVVSKVGLGNFEPWLPNYILGKWPRSGGLLVGEWEEDGMPRSGENLLHQVGVAFQEWESRVLINVRIRLFASYDRTPIYRVLAGILTIPLRDALAPLGLEPIPPSA
jgi:hypothetical protein